MYYYRCACALILHNPPIQRIQLVLRSEEEAVSQGNPPTTSVQRGPKAELLGILPTREVLLHIS